MADCTTLCSAGRALSRILRLRSSSLLTLFLADARVLCCVRDDDDSTDVSSRNLSDGGEGGASSFGGRGAGAVAVGSDAETVAIAGGAVKGR